MIAAARLISKLAHKGQVDKAGIDYFTHADAVALMTHAKGVPYMDYVKEIGKNLLARKVKLADLTHNMDIRRIRNPRQKDYDRIEKKYKPAYEYLKGE